jgi:hypothetical protein
VACLLGSFGLFFTMFCLFVRFLPMVATAEVKTVLPQADPHWQPGPERLRAEAPARLNGAQAGEIKDHRAAPQPLGAPEPAPRRSLRMPFDSLRSTFDRLRSTPSSVEGSLRAMPMLVNRLPEGPYYGILAGFATPADLSHACERVRDAGFTRWDAHSPFPVHGLAGAMGIRRSTLPWIVLGMGLLGAALGFVLQWWVHTTAYPLVISGKPYFAWPAYVPITFEVGVLFGALGAVFGMLGLNRLPMHYHPLFRSKVFERVTDDAFFISIESWDPRFDPSATGKLLESLGARSVELLES